MRDPPSRVRSGSRVSRDALARDDN